MTRAIACKAALIALLCWTPSAYGQDAGALPPPLLVPERPVYEQPAPPPPASEPPPPPAAKIVHVPIAVLQMKAERAADAERAEPELQAPIVWRPEARVMTGFELQRERPSADQGGDATTDYGLFLDQARVGLEAEIDLLSVDVSADLADAIRPRTSASAFNKPPYLRNAYLNLKLHKAFRVRAGRFKRPFSRLELTSSGDLPFRGRGLSNGLIVEDAQWGDRALGLMLWGRLPGKLRWHAAISNPSWAPDNDLEANGLDVLGRLEWEAIDELELGISGGHKLEVRSGSEQHGNAVNADVRVKAGAFSLVLDAMLAQLVSLSAATAGAPASVALGLAAYATYDVKLTTPLRLQPVLFGEFADADADFSRTEAVRVIVGANLLVGDHVRVMPQVELVRPLGTASTLSPWSSGETYTLMLTAQL